MNYLFDNWWSNTECTSTYMAGYVAIHSYTRCQCDVRWHDILLTHHLWHKTFTSTQCVCSHNLYRTLFNTYDGVRWGMCTTDITVLFTSRSAINGVFYHGKSIHFTHYFTIKWLQNDWKITDVCLSTANTRCYRRSMETCIRCTSFLTPIHSIMSESVIASI